MPTKKKLPRINKAGGTPYKTKGANYWDNGNVAFRTKAEKEEIEQIETKLFVADLIANTDFKNLKPEQRSEIDTLKDFLRHERIVKGFKRKML